MFVVSKTYKERLNVENMEEEPYYHMFLDPPLLLHVIYFHVNVPKERYLNEQMMTVYI